MLNKYGIQAMVTQTIEESDIHENGEAFYIVEIAVPLQYFGLENLKEVQELDYRIGLRGIIKAPQAVLPQKSTGRTIDGRQMSQAWIEDTYIKALDTYTPTELKGKYRLAEMNK